MCLDYYSQHIVDQGQRGASSSESESQLHLCRVIPKRQASCSLGSPLPGREKSVSHNQFLGSTHRNTDSQGFHPEQESALRATDRLNRSGNRPTNLARLEADPCRRSDRSGRPRWSSLDAGTLQPQCDDEISSARDQNCSRRFEQAPNALCWPLQWSIVSLSPKHLIRNIRCLRK